MINKYLRKPPLIGLSYQCHVFLHSYLSVNGIFAPHVYTSIGLGRLEFPGPVAINFLASRMTEPYSSLCRRETWDYGKAI